MNADVQYVQHVFDQYYDGQTKVNREEPFMPKYNQNYNLTTMPRFSEASDNVLRLWYIMCIILGLFLVLAGSGEIRLINQVPPRDKESYLDTFVGFAAVGILVGFGLMGMMVYAIYGRVGMEMWGEKNLRLKRDLLKSIS